MNIFEYLMREQCVYAMGHPLERFFFNTNVVSMKSYEHAFYVNVNWAIFPYFYI